MGWLRFATLISVIALVCTGCTTQMQHRTDEERDAGRTSERIAGGTGEAPGTADTAPAPSPATDRSQLATRLESQDLDGFSPVTDSDGIPAVIAATTPDGTGRALLAVLRRDDTISLYEQRASVTGGFTDTFQIRPLAADVILERVDVLTLNRQRDRFNGFVVLLSRDDRTEELYVIATETGVYTVRMPLSTATRTVIRDLNEDGTAEMVQYSRVFEAGGRREVIIDAFVWDGTGFTHDRSLAVLRLINERLRRLRTQLATASAQSRRFDEALRRQDNSPVPSAVFPAADVRVPAIPELLVELGSSEWTLNHELALFDESRRPLVYQIQIHVVANPYAERTVSIVDLD